MTTTGCIQFLERNFRVILSQVETTTTVKAKTVTHSPGYKPGGGKVRIMSAKKDYSTVKSRTDTGPKSASSKASSGKIHRLTLKFDFPIT